MQKNLRKKYLKIHNLNNFLMITIGLTAFQSIFGMVSLNVEHKVIPIFISI